MSEKEYIVTLNKDVDYAQFNQDMIASTGAGDIPNRTVDVADARPGSQRNTHYALTEAEANALKNDSRVLDVAIPPDQDDNLEIGTIASESVTFYKGTSDSGQYYDWGKHRHSIAAETVAWYPSLSGTYNYILDGTGVDVVIQDSGLQNDHPEFQDANGNSRFVALNWYTASGLSGTQNSNHDRDFDGHGTHCAGTAVGKTFGWARNAAIYGLKVNGLEGSGDSGTGISISNCFDVIKLWHRKKPVDPITGCKRPTIINASWGYSTTVGTMTEVSYRGVTYNSGNDGSFNSTPNTHMRDTYGIYPYYSNFAYRCPVRVTSVDVDVQELIDEGVHVCVAAGNNSYKMDISTGDDYNNTLTRSGTAVYYHRGSSPYSEEAFMVGSLLSENAVGDKKVSFSSCGPAVDIYAAGDEITSCTSNTNRFSDAAYWGDSSFRQCNINGTSMAAPQVCGVGALYLQANPNASPAELRQMIHNDSSISMVAGTSNGYGNTDNAMGGPRRVLVQRYNNSVPYVNNLTGKYNIRS